MLIGQTKNVERRAVVIMMVKEGSNVGDRMRNKQNWDWILSRPFEIGFSESFVYFGRCWMIGGTLEVNEYGERPRKQCVVC